MHKVSVQTVYSRCLSCVQKPKLCTPSTAFAKYLTSQVFFVHSINPTFSEFVASYTQAKRGVLCLLNPYLYPLSPALIATNKITI